MVNIFTCRCPNRSGVDTIDSPDLFEQVLDQRYIPEVSEKIFTHDISMIRRQKMVIFGALLKETWDTCAEEVCPSFSIGPLRFSLRTPEDLLNLLESLEKNVEVPWKNERYISSAQEVCSSFFHATSPFFSRDSRRCIESSRVSREKCRGRMEKRSAYSFRAITLSFL